MSENTRAFLSAFRRVQSRYEACQRASTLRKEFVPPLFVDTDTYTVFEQNHCCRTRGDVILRVPPGMGKDLVGSSSFFPVKIDLHASI